MYDREPPRPCFVRWTIGAIVAALMLLAACDPRRAIGDTSSGSLMPSVLWSLK
jgi:hypothetical protein